MAGYAQMIITQCPEAFVGLASDHRDSLVPLLGSLFEAFGAEPHKIWGVGTSDDAVAAVLQVTEAVLLGLAGEHCFETCFAKSPDEDATSYSLQSVCFGS